MAVTAAHLGHLIGFGVAFSLFTAVAVLWARQTAIEAVNTQKLKGWRHKWQDVIESGRAAAAVGRFALSADRLGDKMEDAAEAFARLARSTPEPPKQGAAAPEVHKVSPNVYLVGEPFYAMKFNREELTCACGNEIITKFAPCCSRECWGTKFE